MEPARKRQWRVVAIGVLAFASAATAAQASGTCEFSVAALVATRIQLQEAKSAHQACARARRTKCTAEKSRMRELEQHLKLLGNYLDRYCMR